MITDRHLFSELAYISPKALVALKDAIYELYGDYGYEDENGQRYTSEGILADLLIDLASTECLQITVVTQNGSCPSEELVLGEDFFGNQGEVLPAKLEELTKKLCRRSSVYATAVIENEAVQKGGDQ